jgi:hypothetical protein
MAGVCIGVLPESAASAGLLSVPEVEGGLLLKVQTLVAKRTFYTNVPCRVSLQLTKLQVGKGGGFIKQGKCQAPPLLMRRFIIIIVVNAASLSAENQPIRLKVKGTPLAE